MLIGIGIKNNNKYYYSKPLFIDTINNNKDYFYGMLFKDMGRILFFSNYS